jgi:hypothetical protein
MLDFYVFFDRMTPRIGCGNRQHHPYSEVRPNARLHSCRTGMKKGAGLRRQLGDFKWDLRRQMECRRQDGGTSPVSFRELRCLDISLIGIAIRLHEFAKPQANLIQPMFHSLLPAETRAHDPQRCCKGAYQGRNRAAGWNRSRCGHFVQKVRERFRVPINRLLLPR